MAIVIQKQNPLAAFLEPVGEALKYRIGLKREEEEYARQTKRSILSQVLSGGLDPRYLAAQEAEPLLQELGLSDDPAIQALIAQGKEGLSEFEAPQYPTQEVAGPPVPGDTEYPGAQLEGPPVTPRATARDVREMIAGEEAQRGLGVKQAGLNMEATKEIYVALQKQAIESGTYTPAVEAAIDSAFEKSLGPGWKKTLKINEKGEKSLTIEQETRDQRNTSLRTTLLNLDDYLKPVEDTHGGRTAYIKAAQQILRGELESAFSWLNTLSPEIAAITEGLMQNKKSISRLKPKEQVSLFLASVNKAIEKRNQASADRGMILMGSGQFPTITKERIMGDMAPLIEFDEVAGMSQDEWDKTPEAPDPAKTAADNAAKEAGGGSPQAVSPSRPDSQAKADSSGAKVKTAYDEITKRIEAALAKPGSTTDAVMTAMFAPNMRGAMMSHYGFNARELEALEKMVRAGSKKMKK